MFSKFLFFFFLDFTTFKVQAGCKLRSKPDKIIEKIFILIKNKLLFVLESPADWQLLQADPLARLAVGTLALHMVRIL